MRVNVLPVRRRSSMWAPATIVSNAVIPTTTARTAEDRKTQQRSALTTAAARHNKRRFGSVVRSMTVSLDDRVEWRYQGLEYRRRSIGGCGGLFRNLRR